MIRLGFNLVRSAMYELVARGCKLNHEGDLSEAERADRRRAIQEEMQPLSLWLARHDEEDHARC